MGNYTYSKVEVLLGTELKDPKIQSSEVKTYTDSQINLSGNFLIISKIAINEENKQATSHVVYPLEKIITYRTTL
jgi:hypothetical protein